MALLSHQISSLVQGMSQRDPKLRHPNEAERVLNAVCDPSRGVGKRPGTQHLAFFASPVNDVKNFVHWIPRDDTERYVLMYDGVTLFAYDLSGTRIPVFWDDDEDALYLSGGRPEKDLRALTISDSTFIVNRTKTVSLTDDTEDAITDEALVWIRAGNYGIDYNLKIDGSDAGTITAHSSLPTEIDTAFLADDLKNNATGYDANKPAGFDAAVLYESVLLIKRTDDADFEIQGTDGVSNSNMVVVKNEVARFSDLPPIAPPGYKALVSGLEEESADDYWVEFTADDPSETMSTGKWEECAAPSSQGTFDSDTMPLRVDRLQDDVDGTVTGTPYAIYFKVFQPSWDSRPAGDATTNEAPTFVGSTISNLFLADNRLGFLSGSAVILSRAGDFYQLWRTSVLDTPADGRIDAVPSSGQIKNFSSAVPQANSFLLVSDTGVVTLDLREPLTPQTIRFLPASSISVDDRGDPVRAGRSAFLPVRGTTYADIREVYDTGESSYKDGFLVTEHVPRLIRGRVRQMEVSDTHHTLWVIGQKEDRSLLYVYRWLDTGGNANQRVQSAWGYWNVGNDVTPGDDDVLSMKVIDDALYLLICRPDGIALEAIELDPDEPQVGTNIPHRLDRFVVVAPADTDLPTGPDLPGNDDDDDDGPTDSTGAGTGSSSSFGSPGQDVSFEDDPRPSGGSSVPGAGAGDDLEEDPGDTPTAQTTTFTLPYSVRSHLVLVRLDTGEVIPYNDGVLDTQIIVAGDYTNTPLAVGEAYRFSYTFSPALVRHSTQTGGLAAVTDARIQLHRFHVNHRRSGPFLGQVLERDTGETLDSVPFSLDNVGDVLNSLDPEDGTFGIPVHMDAARAKVRVESSWHWPVWLVSADWEGDVTKRSRVAG